MGQTHTVIGCLQDPLNCGNANILSLEKETIDIQLDRRVSYRTSVPLKKAVIVAINYSGTQDALTACHNDAHSIRQALRALQFEDENIRILSDEDHSEMPTKTNILKAVRWLVEDARDGDARSFFFCGLSSEITTFENSKIGAMLPIDFRKNNCVITEIDILKELEVAPANVQFSIFVDSSYVGLRACTGQTVMSKTSHAKAAELLLDCSEVRVRYCSNPPDVVVSGSHELSKLLCNVYCFTGSRNGQVAVECEINGLWQGTFSYILSKILNQRGSNAGRTGHFRLTVTDLDEELGSQLNQLKSSPLLHTPDNDFAFSSSNNAPHGSILFVEKIFKATNEKSLSRCRTESTMSCDSKRSNSIGSCFSESGAYLSHATHDMSKITSVDENFISPPSGVETVAPSSTRTDFVLTDPATTPWGSKNSIDERVDCTFNIENTRVGSFNWSSENTPAVRKNATPAVKSVNSTPWFSSNATQPVRNVHSTPRVNSVHATPAVRNINQIPRVNSVHAASTVTTKVHATPAVRNIDAILRGNHSNTGPQVDAAFYQLSKVQTPQTQPLSIPTYSKHDYPHTPGVLSAIQTPVQFSKDFSAIQTPVHFSKDPSYFHRSYTYSSHAMTSR
eukprot:GHVL01032803.1.p1 GENE.GHVL01032803.1~~GHVL01032803.1.p1  ORF type:complete len:620 (+),score=76.41 GHVL01032803.1:44-1903(+)